MSTFMLINKYKFSPYKTTPLPPPAPPDAPRDLHATSDLWHTASLTWNPGFDGGYQQHFYIHQSEEGGQGEEIEVKQVNSRSFNVTGQLGHSTS